MIVSKIVDKVCSHISIKLGVKDLKKDSRLRDVIDARRIAYYILREKYNLPYASIGSFFNKDHATVLHSYKSAKDLIKYDIIFKEKFDACVDSFYKEKDEIKLIEALEDFKISVEDLDVKIDSMDKNTGLYELLKKITKFNNNLIELINNQAKFQDQWEKITQD